MSQTLLVREFENKLGLRLSYHLLLLLHNAGDSSISTATPIITGVKLAVCVLTETSH